MAIALLFTNLGVMFYISISPSCWWHWCFLYC